MDLSSLEGPPLQNNRFSVHVISPLLAPQSTAYHGSRRRETHSGAILSPISPLDSTSGPFSNFTASSQDPATPDVEYDLANNRWPPRPIARLYDTNRYLEHHRSHSSLSPSRQLEPQVSLRPSRSHSSLTSSPAYLSPAGNRSSHPVELRGSDNRLVWVEEHQLWVLLLEPPARTDLPQTRNNDTFPETQHPHNQLMQYYDPVAGEYQTPNDLPPSYESHNFSSTRGTHQTPGHGVGHRQESWRSPRQQQHSDSEIRQMQHRSYHPDRPSELFPERWPRRSDNGPSPRSQWDQIAERLIRSALA